MTGFRDLFLYPAKLCWEFVLSLFGMAPSQFQPQVDVLVTGLLALVFWLYCMKALIAIAKRIFGFNKQEVRR